MRSLKTFLLATAMVIPVAPALACPEDGGDHRYFAFAGQFQNWQSRSSQPAPSQDQEPSGTPSSGSQDSGSSEPAPSSTEPAPGGPASGDAATFR